MSSLKLHSRSFGWLRAGQVRARAARSRGLPRFAMTDHPLRRRLQRTVKRASMPVSHGVAAHGITRRTERAEQPYPFNAVETLKRYCSSERSIAVTLENAADLPETRNRSWPFVKVCNDQH